MDGSMDLKIEMLMDGWTYVWMDKWIDGCMDGWIWVGR